MSIVKVLPDSNTTWDYDFDVPPTKDQMDTAVRGIGGRPRDREGKAVAKEKKGE